MKIKRVIAACLAAVMMVLPLSGCGNSSGEQQGNGSGHVEVLRIGTTYKKRWLQCHEQRECLWPSQLPFLFAAEFVAF